MYHSQTTKTEQIRGSEVPLIGMDMRGKFLNPQHMMVRPEIQVGSTRGFSEWKIIWILQDVLKEISLE